MKKVILGLSLLLVPMLVFGAQINLNYFTGGFEKLASLFRILVVVLVSLAVIFFIWNVIKYTISSSADDKKEAVSKIIWGLVGIAVIVSIWGLVGIIQRIFGVSNSTPAPISPGSPIQGFSL